MILFTEDQFPFVVLCKLSLFYPQASDMFSMLVHSCFVDDGNGQEKKALVDEHGYAENVPFY